MNHRRIWETSGASNARRRLTMERDSGTEARDEFIDTELGSLTSSTSSTSSARSSVAFLESLDVKTTRPTARQHGRNPGWQWADGQFIRLNNCVIRQGVCEFWLIKPIKTQRAEPKTRTRREMTSSGDETGRKTNVEH